MAYEFKKLSAVEAVETPADTANVLIEEDGVIKKTPSGMFTGGGGDAYDLDVLVDDSGKREVLTGSYDELYAKLIACVPVKVRIRYVREWYYEEHFPVEVWYDGDNEYISIWALYQHGRRRYNFRPDNSVEVANSVVFATES
jgi:hypothetical protein